MYRESPRQAIRSSLRLAASNVGAVSTFLMTAVWLPVVRTSGSSSGTSIAAGVRQPLRFGPAGSHDPRGLHCPTEQGRSLPAAPGPVARDQLELVDTKNGRTTRAPLTVKGANFNVLAASGDGRRIVAAGELSGAEGTNVQIGHFWVWEVETGQIVTRFPALLAPIPRPEDKEGLAQLSSGQIVTMVVDQKASRIATADDRGVIRRMGRRRRKTPVDAGGHDRCESGARDRPRRQALCSGWC